MLGAKTTLTHDIDSTTQSERSAEKRAVLAGAALRPHISGGQTVESPPCLSRRTSSTNAVFAGRSPDTVNSSQAVCHGIGRVPRLAIHVQGLVGTVVGERARQRRPPG